MSGGKRSQSAAVHLKLLLANLNEVRGWDDSENLPRRRMSKVLYVLGITSAEFPHLWDLYKKYKAGAGADAKTFSSWYTARLLETLSPKIEVTELRGKLDSAIKLVEAAKPVVVAPAAKLQKLEQFEGIVKDELAAFQAGTIKISSTLCCRRGCGASYKNAGHRTRHENKCEYVRDPAEEPEDDVREPRSLTEWLSLATDHGVPQTLVSIKVRGAGGFQDRGWAASAHAAAVAYRAELEAEQKAVGTEDAAEDGAKDAAGDAFNAIVKALKAHELAACRDLNPKQLDDRFLPRAKALAAHYKAASVKGGNSCAALGVGSLAAAMKKNRASRLRHEYSAHGYVPHNNDPTTQAARRAEGIYDGADLYAALTGIGRP